jgi:glycosyltransferase involved in cell wall biosynthesis
MRILIVSNNFPDDLRTKVHGVFMRFRMFFDVIKDLAEIDLLYYVPQRTDTSPSSVSRLERSFSSHFKTPIRLFLCRRSERKTLFAKGMSYAAGTFSLIRQPLFSGMAGTNQVQALETCLHNKPDAVFVHKLGAMGPLLQIRSVLPPIFLDLDDIEHVAFRRGLRYIPKISRRLLNSLLFPALFRGECKAVQSAHRTFICSDKDRDYLTNRLALKGVVKVPNAVKIPPPQRITSEKTMLFLGSYSYKPNIDAAEFLIQKIWPLIHRDVPDARLIISGNLPDKIPSYRADKKAVRFTGFVEDLDALYRQTRVICVPILAGGGTRVKILEAAAYGKPIVSTRIGAEGLEMRDGCDILICDAPQSFADACIMLLNDHEKCNKIGGAGRIKVMNTYDKEKVKEKIKKTILQAMTNSQKMG